MPHRDPGKKKKPPKKKNTEEEDEEEVAAGEIFRSWGPDIVAMAMRILTRPRESKWWALWKTENL
jgi:hypothetical protein